MIIKVKGVKRLDFERVLRYIVQDRDERSFVIKHNLRGSHLADWIREFAYNERTYRKGRRKNANRLTHEIMSFAAGDSQHLTTPVLKDLARQYIQKRGQEALALAVPHFDTDHIHLHFCFSGIKYKSSQSMRMSKRQFTKLKQDIQQYQLDRYPELTYSIVWHGRNSRDRVTDRECRVVKRKGESDKQRVRRLIEEARRATSSEGEFYTFLHEHNITPYERGGRVVGVVYMGMKYRWRVIGGVKRNIVKFRSQRQNKNRQV